MTLNDLEPPKYGFKWFFCYFSLRCTLRVNVRWNILEKDQDNLRAVARLMSISSDFLLMKLYTHIRTILAVLNCLKLHRYFNLIIRWYIIDNNKYNKQQQLTTVETVAQLLTIVADNFIQPSIDIAALHVLLASLSVCPSQHLYSTRKLNKI